jgi:DNA-binding transcriptional MerR regulator
MHDDGIKKLYYSIGEVSEMTGLEQHVLRYWESEFEQLKPRKNRAGRRVYTDDDIAMVERIHHLLKDEKYTIEGAKQVLERNEDEGGEESIEKEDLVELRDFLRDILDELTGK